MIRFLVQLLRGFRGHPAHPPLTDASIGAYTAGVVAVVLGWLGVEEATMAKAAFVAIAVGLVVTVATIVSGVVDYLRIPRGTALWNATTVHWIVMLFATSAFLTADAALQSGFETGQVSNTAAVTTVVAYLLLTVGGWIGGALVFVYGMRVTGESDKPATDALLRPEFPPD